MSGDLRKLIMDTRIHLDRDAYAHVQAAEIRGALGEVGADISALVQAANSAPKDPYDLSGLRRRCFQVGLYQPHSKNLQFSDPHYSADGMAYELYFQGDGFNPEQKGRERRFAPFPPDLKDNQALKKLVSLLFDMIPEDLIDKRREQKVGLHLIRIASDGLRKGLSSPPVLHVDGEPQTSVVLLDKHNCTSTSGVNTIAKRGCRGKHPQDCKPEDIVATIRLEKQLDTVMFDDARVSHMVSGICGANEQTGWRTALLIDFSPLIPFRTVQ